MFKQVWYHVIACLIEWFMAWCYCFINLDNEVVLGFWAYVLWFLGLVPHNPFIFWLTFLGRSCTIDRLQAHGVLYDSPIKTHKYIFLGCHLFSSVCGEVKHYKKNNNNNISEWRNNKWIISDCYKYIFYDFSN